MKMGGFFVLFGIFKGNLKRITYVMQYFFANKSFTRASPNSTASQKLQVELKTNKLQNVTFWTIFEQVSNI